MKTAIKKVYLITALSFSTLTVYADNTSVPTILGDYICKRTNAANNTASYPLTISKSNATYTLEWEDSSGNPVLYGTGVMHPNVTNVFSSSFWDPSKPNIVGIEIFTLKPDGTLQANWVLQSDNQVGSEVCTKNR